MIAIGGYIAKGALELDQPWADMTRAYSERGFISSAVRQITAQDSTQDRANAPFGSALSHFTRQGQAAPPPYYDPDAQLSLVADARIDGIDALTAELGMAADDPRRHDDHVLIAEAYKKWGENCPAHLMGDYAFVILDEAQGTVFCARDHIGAKPLFYYDGPDAFIFASDINAVLAAQPEQGQLNDEFIAASLDNGNFYSHTDTFFKRINKLPAAFSLSLRLPNCPSACSSSPHLKRYWNPERVKHLPLQSDAEYSAQLLSLLIEAISDRLRTEEKIGVHVTGGLDSSAIVAISSRMLTQAGRAAPIGYCWQAPPKPPSAANPLSGEYQRIEDAAQLAGLSFEYVAPTADQLYTIYRRDCTTSPCDKTLYNEYPVQLRAQAASVGVILSGWGGDQCISYNGRSYEFELFRTLRWRTLAKLYRAANGRVMSHFIGRVALPSLSPRVLKLYAAITNPNRHRRAKQNFINPELNFRKARTVASAPKRKSVRETQIHYLKEGLVTRRLEEWAASGRDVGIEYRYPLTDRRILEFALGLPGGQYRKGQWGRWIFRNTLNGLIPQSVCWNQSKFEGERVATLKPAFIRMAKRLTRELQDGTLRTSRGRYVDVEALITAVQSETYGDNNQFGPTQTALRVLDFTPAKPRS